MFYEYSTGLRNIRYTCVMCRCSHYRDLSTVVRTARDNSYLQILAVSFCQSGVGQQISPPLPAFKAVIPRKTSSQELTARRCRCRHTTHEHGSIQSARNRQEKDATDHIAHLSLHRHQPTPIILLAPLIVLRYTCKSASKLPGSR